ncbi:hypothetical protein [Hoeflea sp.]|uniref:hypothetical protein n=1 Tax=Hoeflea sp. TaxID=1940281 RepID=UPI003B01A647
MSHSVFRKAYDRMIAARQRQANGLIRNYLLAQDDATLQSLGHKREDLEKKNRIPFEI